MLGKMNAKMEAFYNNQFKSDVNLLNILKKKEKENEANMLRKLKVSNISIENSPKNLRN